MNRGYVTKKLEGKKEAETLRECKMKQNRRTV
jgi:hypothetical protein